MPLHGDKVLGHSSEQRDTQAAGVRPQFNKADSSRCRVNYYKSPSANSPIWALEHSSFRALMRIKNSDLCWAVVAHAFNPTIQETEAGGSL